MNKKERFFSHWSPAVFILSVCLILSVLILFIYFTQTDLPDETLFTLLTILRYLAFAIFLNSLYILVSGIVSMIRRPLAITLVGIFFSFFCLIYGAFIMTMEAFIRFFSSGV